jgi:hypothetical protein
MELSHNHQRQGGLTMSFCNQGRFRQQVRFLQRQFLQGGDLPFGDVLTESSVTQALKALNVVWLDRVYSPLVTLWVFLGQVLSRDHSCRAAVARLIATASRVASALALQKRARIAKLGSDYRKSSLQQWLVKLDKCWMRAPTKIGFGKAAAFWSTMAQPCRCPILWKTNKFIRKRPNNSQALDFHWHA